MYYRKIFSAICMMLFFFTAIMGCKKDSGNSLPAENTNTNTNKVSIPSVATLNVENIMNRSASVIGQVKEDGGSAVTQRGVCWSKDSLPTIGDNHAGANSVSGSGKFTTAINNLERGQKYYVRAYAVNKKGTGYGNQLTFTTAKIPPITFVVKPLYIIGSTLASWDVEIAEDHGENITERGICWSAQQTPTIEDHKVKAGGEGLGKYRCNITGLEEHSNYSARAYAITSSGVYYSGEVGFQTIRSGNLTYTLNESENPSDEEKAAFERLKFAMDSAVWYLDHYTSGVKHVYVNYVPGVPTADSNNEGWMRFGDNSAYQNLRTMLHELSHCYGTGTTNWWWNDAIKNGKYQLSNANKILQEITGDATSELHGDSQHYWPYGLNYDSEVSSSWDYVYHCLIVEAMRKDGLPAAGAYNP